MKKYLILFFVLFVVSCSSNFLDEDDALLLLETAYKNNSAESLDEFFNLWYKESLLLKKSNIADTTSYLETTNDFYTQFYFPIIHPYQDEYDYPNYHKAEYLVIQNNINVLVLNGSDTTSMYEQMCDFDTLVYDSISNFFPSVNSKNQKVLYLTPKYQRILDKYFWGELWDMSVYKREDLTDDSLKQILYSKRNFLDNKIKLAKNYWRVQWYYYTFPRVYELIFTKDFKRCAAFYRNSHASMVFIEFHFNGKQWKKVKKLYELSE